MFYMLQREEVRLLFDQPISFTVYEYTFNFEHLGRATHVHATRALRCNRSLTASCESANCHSRVQSSNEYDAIS